MARLTAVFEAESRLFDPVNGTEYDKATSLAGTPPLLTAAARADTILGDSVLMVAADTAGPTTTMTVSRVAADKVEVRFVMSASNPLVTSPAIDWDVTVTIDQAGAYTVECQHDGYPAYDIYINNTRVYQYDPRATGKDVNDLFPPLDEYKITGGTVP
ncbi:MAG: DUF3238 domain-containing protein [Phycisphaeraceae bacterium]